MIGASINEPGCFPFLKGNMGRPGGSHWQISGREARSSGRPLFLRRLSPFVDALLYGTRFCGSARVVRTGCGVCARSACVAAG